MIFGEKYTLLTPKPNATISEKIDDLFGKLQSLDADMKRENRVRVFGRLYFSDILNQLPLFKESALCESLEQAPFSYIEQAPLDGSRLSLIVAYASGVQIARLEDNAWEIVSQVGKAYFHSIRLSGKEVTNLTSKHQTEEQFRRHKRFLNERGLNLRDNCIRTWIYVRDIDYHYAGVVAGRNNIFREEGLKADDHFIASTGIGGYGSNSTTAVCVDFLSIDAPSKIKYLHATEWLNPTHEYGVAFERGTAVTLQNTKTLFISGTASIDKFGNCVHRGNVIKQTERLFQNIDHLLKDGESSLADIRVLIVYLRDISDYHLVSAYLKEHFPQIPMVITEARVCRPEWLIEVECIASRRVINC